MDYPNSSCFGLALRESGTSENRQNINSIEMLPVLWTWFALSKARRAASTGFKEAFELWATNHVLHGNLPVLQQMQKHEWKEINLDSNPLTFAGGVPVAMLGNRSFNAAFKSDSWRIRMHPLVPDQMNAGAEGDKERQTIQLERYSGTSDVPDPSRSLHCEKLIVKALEKLSRQKISGITEVKSATAIGIRFEASGLGQKELLALLMKTAPALKSRSYGGPTVRRSLSFVIRSRRGRPPKCAEVPKKLTNTKPAKRRR